MKTLPNATYGRSASLRDLSLIVPMGIDEQTLDEHVRSALGDDAHAVESLQIRDRTPHRGLPTPARGRLGIVPTQENVLLRVVLRHPERTLTSEEANQLRNRVYQALHEGPNTHRARAYDPDQSASSSRS